MIGQTGELKSALKGIVDKVSHDIFHPFLHEDNIKVDGNLVEHSRHEKFEKIDIRSREPEFMGARGVASFVLKNALMPAAAHNIAHGAVQATETFVHGNVIHSCPPEAMDLLNHLAGLL